MSSISVLDRRAPRQSPSATPLELVESHVKSAEWQLAVAREGLIEARRRVGALQDAVQNWQDFARMLGRDAQDRATGTH